ncbi:MMPL family transporter [Paenibacillus sp. SYP-B3998]|uniref:MMPL family transporter n=1 Tax=Paenibacillus sp. SYP-B3998 TaxID=2678564 RepID=A0A6G4A5I2_9BACL|nr:MMPL family transporter [Paenibacillus sp. SYP-B3998]NEW09204.1 MMPL family transporter [Paenibacillus sp. SYP-B3998]
MNPFSHKWASWVSSSKGAKIVLTSWLLVIIILSAVAPSSKQVAQSGGEGSIHEDTLSAAAQQILKEQYPFQDGLTALLVFHGQSALSEAERVNIQKISEWLSSDQKPTLISSAVPFHKLPKPQQDKLFSQDQSTLLLTVSLQKGLESGQIYDTLQQIRKYAEQVGTGTVKLEITGPAGISSDTILLFKKADFVLMLATIVLILVILIVIYRSPLLALLPLVLAGLVYEVVDRLIGLAGKLGWFFVEKQSLSIMMILLFAVLTDYCLFIVARYRTELKKSVSKYDAMTAALSTVAEPILFSGGTVLIAMLTLFTAVFKPYNHFAPVFSVAMVIILLGGLTLIPAAFALVGRKAFWPLVPKVQLVKAEEQPKGFWTKVSAFVTKKPGITAIVLLALLVGSSLSSLTMSYSFNLMKSFPSDISSRQGFDILQERFPQGQLAPVTVVLTSEREIALDASFIDKAGVLVRAIKERKGVSAITPEIAPELLAANNPTAASMLGQQKHTVKFQLTLQQNPYDQEALDFIRQLRTDSDQLLRDSGFDPAQYALHYAGQTAEQLDVRTMNRRDTIVLFSLITLFITAMLVWQARSFRLALTMMATMLLSYAATMGLVWGVCHYGFGYDAFSYRLPVYTFVFLIALGVDYNIILVSRIKEEARKYEWREAIQRGVALTGGVISSAGIVLAATFCVLMTQPLQELMLFGFAMAAGILIDTFLVRGMLLPALMTYLGRSTKFHPAKSSAKL